MTGKGVDHARELHPKSGHEDLSSGDDDGHEFFFLLKEVDIQNESPSHTRHGVAAGIALCHTHQAHPLQLLTRVDEQG
jgi:hypothetical protein